MSVIIPRNIEQKTGKNSVFKLYEYNRPKIILSNNVKFSHNNARNTVKLTDTPPVGLKFKSGKVSVSVIQ